MSGADRSYGGVARIMLMTASTWTEHAGLFECKGEQCVAIYATPTVCYKRGVIVVVGGPQYRAGSHRQFTLLCRGLAAHGIAAMRFDYRGMGDSGGDARTFEDVADDLRAATDAFFERHPQVGEVVLWGLCDGASAALLHACTDPRITGLVLLNPWVRTAAGLARAYVRGYYVKRLFEPAFWGKLLRGRLNLVAAGRGLAANVRTASGGSQREDGATRAAAGSPLPQRMLQGWHRFKGRILVVLSGNDLTADEFRALAADDRGWKKAMSEPRVQRCDVPHANHTFSSAEWRGEVEWVTAQWVKSW